MANFNKGNFTKVWLKRKTKQVFKGENKGDDYDIFIGHVDIGGGKMIELSFYANQEPVSVKDDEMFVLNARKWKGQPRNKKRNKTW